MIQNNYETEHLNLRILSSDQAALVLSFYERNFADFSQYEPLDEQQGRSLSFHKKLLDVEMQTALRGSSFRFYLFEKEDPFTVIGTISYRNILHGLYQTCQVGYKMDKEYRRKGYCSEALSFLDHLMMSEVFMHRIEAYVLPDNIASLTMLEKIGYRREGLIRDKIFLNGHWADHYLLSKIS